ncbi:MAG: chemotaxis protein CheW [Gemmatimonadaceae bacterium]|nr:chemotaxis protein CheW [Gemmatimonadaceae bacterium]
MEPHRLLSLFLAEGRELLARVEAELLVLERAPASAPARDAVFRSLHSLKGMCATVGLHQCTDALHAGETLLTAAREAGTADGDTPAALVDLANGLRLALDAAESRQPEPPLLAAHAARLTALAARVAQPAADAGRQGAARAVRQATAAAAGAQWRVQAQLAADTAIPSARAAVVLRRLAAVAPVLQVLPDSDARCADGWDGAITVWLGAGGDAVAIEQAVRGAGDIAGCHVAHEGAAPATAPVAAAARTVRIPAQRLDTLLDLVGELVLARDRLLRAAQPTADDAVRGALEDTSRLVMQLRDAILSSRLVPLAQVLDRFPRHVRETAAALGKDVELVIEGRELEVDRSLLDELGEPLLHLLRNAVDHGIEQPAVRRAVGKPARGRVVVRAVRDGAMVAVTVADDGAGVDRAGVAAAAAGQGVADAARLVHDDGALLQLLARPGLSTAGSVTTLSGRGVGMDAVLARVQALGGRIDLVTARGDGTAITLRLPLSVAMLRALLVRVASEVYAIPLTLVHSTQLATPDGGALGGADATAGGGDRARTVSLRSHLGLPPAVDVSGHLVVLEGATGRVALRVDACLAQQEIVVKPLQRVRGAATLFSGGTILPDGTPSLILDINSLP